MNAGLEMKRIALRCLHIVCLFFFLSISGFSQEDDKFTVVLDAGHGGKDPGAIGSFSYEKDIALKLALKVGQYIKERHSDVEVIYTRKTDEFIELYKRAQIANKNHADLFISIHINSASTGRAYGTETFVMGLHKSKANLAVAKKENAVILKEDNYEDNYEGFNPNSPESTIIFSLYQNAYLDQSLNLASMVQDQFKERVGRHDRGVKQAGFWVLYKTAMPSVLIEAGFISNPEEEKYLNSEDGIVYMASAIYRAFRDYKKAIEEDELLTDDAAKDLLTQQKEEEAPDQSNTEEHKTDASGDSHKSFEGLSFPPASDSILFRVQIYTSGSALKSPRKFFQDLASVWEYKQDSLYKYTCGKSYSYDYILKYHKTIQNKYPDSFIVSFCNDKRIPLEDAIKAIKN